MSGDERPTIVVSAVAMVRDGQVLTVRKRGTCRFMLPGGKWEPGEEPDDAAIREVREELGLVVEGVQLLGVFEADAANEPGHLVRSHVFVAQLPGEPQIAAEIEELRWVALDAAPADDLAPLTKRLLPLLARRNPVAQPSLADQFRHHFGHHEHLYGVLLDHLADDLDAGGATARICRDKLSASRGDAIQLRLLAAIYRIVLRGEAPELVRFYPALGGTEDPALAWPYLRPLLTTHEAELRAALDLPPQTNEVGRSAGLIIALFEAVRRSGLRKVRLLEPGASAGLNLHVDRYAYRGTDWAWGSSTLTMETGALGVEPVEFEIVERGGCDLSPVDASTSDGATYLRSFVWPFDLARSERLARALEIAGQHPVTVDEAPAAQWMSAQLARPVDEDILTVVWQSITRQYWPESESDAVDAAIADARERVPIVHITMEGVPPVQGSDGYVIEAHGPALTIDGDVIARSHHHGLPVILA